MNASRITPETVHFPFTRKAATLVAAMTCCIAAGCASGASLPDESHAPVRPGEPAVDLGADPAAAPASSLAVGDGPVADRPATQAAGKAAADATDASEIAARAIASALDGPEGELHTDFAAGAYDAVTRDLLMRIEAIQKEHGNVARELEAPLFELGKLYASADQCRNAIPILRQAILLNQRLDGVMTPRQLPKYEPLLDCYVTLDLLPDLQRAQERMLLVHERMYGKHDVRMLPALSQAGWWYEQAGQYEGARGAYQRAIRIVREAEGERDIRMVDPLRGLARTYRLEMQYEPEAWRGRSLDAQGQRMLEQAAEIVREHPEVSSALRIDTLLDLGDWQQMSGALRDAVKTYREVWQAADAAGGSGARVLGRPEPILYRAAIGRALRRAPVNRKELKHYWIDFEFTVTRLGEVDDVVSNSATAPRYLQAEIAENLKRTHYRPRFVDGEAVDTIGVRLRQGVWVGD